jgi:hypothetical protein
MLATGISEDDVLPFYPRSDSLIPCQSDLGSHRTFSPGKLHVLYLGEHLEYF